ncbi:metal ABC transporter permease [Chloroflexus sp.]|uniref:metal ABC transporter permease n=2 Tax=Chloroflexus sp. TaxID=1904827 RepID=UPI0029FB8098|nr:iron chelate uptake ABC transporter family permease subunit [Chloroflexus sp.]MCS6887771.1 metal ABC transporter permease [Chloroflexus sp.]MCX7859898.1 metal ABC transporter permease [Chloroflexus sp.]
MDLLTDYTLRNVTIGAMLLGAISGLLGCFAVLRRQALLGDAMSHAALPGIALAFLLTGQRNTFTLLLGAAVAALAAALWLLAIVRTSRIKDDAALALILAVFFGFGLVLLSYLQRQPTAAQAGLKSFLFGQAAALVERDLWAMLAIGGPALALVAIFWPQVKLISFDPDFARSLGLPVRRFEVLLTGVIVAAIVIGLQTVGVVLMSAMLIAPAVAARQWTNRLETMVLLAAGFGALAAFAGAWISALGEGLATGPVIVLVMSALTALSLLIAPERGLLWRRWRMARRWLMGNGG